MSFFLLGSLRTRTLITIKIEAGVDYGVLPILFAAYTSPRKCDLPFIAYLWAFYLVINMFYNAVGVFV